MHVTVVFKQIFAGGSIGMAFFFLSRRVNRLQAASGLSVKRGVGVGVYLFV